MCHTAYILAQSMNKQLQLLLRGKIPCYRIFTLGLFTLGMLQYMHVTTHIFQHCSHVTARTLEHTEGSKTPRSPYLQTSYLGCLPASELLWGCLQTTLHALASFAETQKGLLNLVRRSMKFTASRYAIDLTSRKSRTTCSSGPCKPIATQRPNVFWSALHQWLTTTAHRHGAHH
jgi:hypothetical protein